MDVQRVASQRYYGDRTGEATQEMHGRGGESARRQSPGKERPLVLLAPLNNSGYTPLIRRVLSKILRLWENMDYGFCVSYISPR